jgi:hypothetical protein
MIPTNNVDRIREGGAELRALFNNPNREAVRRVPEA